MECQTQQPHLIVCGNFVLDIQEGICFGDLRRIFENFNEAVLLNNKDSVAAIIAMRQKKRLVEAEISKGFYEYHIIIFS